MTTFLNLITASGPFQNVILISFIDFGYMQLRVQCDSDPAAGLFHARFGVYRHNGFVEIAMALAGWLAACMHASETTKHVWSKKHTYRSLTVCGWYGNEHGKTKIRQPTTAGPVVSISARLVALWARHIFQNHVKGLNEVNKSHQCGSTLGQSQPFFANYSSWNLWKLSVRTWDQIRWFQSKRPILWS